MNTTYWRNSIMNSTYGSGSYYIGLSSTEPQPNGTGVTEPPTSGTAYARVSVGGFSSAVDGAVHNTSAITFPESTSTWFPLNAPATHWVLFDGTGANAHVLSAGTLEEPISILQNTTISIAATKIVITLIDAVTPSV